MENVEQDEITKPVENVEPKKLEYKDLSRHQRTKHNKLKKLYPDINDIEELLKLKLPPRPKKKEIKKLDDVPEIVENPSPNQEQGLPLDDEVVKEAEINIEDYPSVDEELISKHKEELEKKLQKQKEKSIEIAKKKISKSKKEIPVQQEQEEEIIGWTPYEFLNDYSSPKVYESPFYKLFHGY